MTATRSERGSTHAGMPASPLSAKPCTLSVRSSGSLSGARLRATDHFGLASTLRRARSSRIPKTGTRFRQKRLGRDRTTVPAQRRARKSQVFQEVTRTPPIKPACTILGSRSVSFKSCRSVSLSLSHACFPAFALNADAVDDAVLAQAAPSQARQECRGQCYRLGAASRIAVQRRQARRIGRQGHADVERLWLRVGRERESDFRDDARGTVRVGGRTLVGEIEVRSTRQPRAGRREPEEARKYPVRTVWHRRRRWRGGGRCAGRSIDSVWCATSASTSSEHLHLGGRTPTSSYRDHARLCRFAAITSLSSTAHLVRRRESSRARAKSRERR